MGILNLDDVPPPFGADERPGHRPAPGGEVAGANPAGPASGAGEAVIPPHVTGSAPPPQASPAPGQVGRPPVPPPRGLGEPVIPPHVDGSAPPPPAAPPSQAAPTSPSDPDVSSSSIFDTSALTGPGPAGPAGQEPPGPAPAPGTPPPPAAPAIESDPVKTLELKPLIVEQLSTVFDPEIPVNIYELGLIYDVAVDGKGLAVIQMTLTAPGCPAAITLPAEVQGKVKAIEGVSDARVDLVWEPPWDKDRMSDAAKLQLGIFD